MAYSIGLRKILIESNSLCAVQLIHRREVIHYSSLSMVRVIKELMARDWNVEVNDNFRETNQCADMLARRGHDIQLGTKFYVSNFYYLSIIFTADMTRVSCPRLVGF